jgi:hypothetical protein
MGPGSFNVMYITLGGFTLPNDFYEPFEALTTFRNWCGGTLISP